MIIEPKVKGFLCISAHPAGCEANVKSQIDYVKSQGAIKDGCKSALIIGASTGYGLASRIVSAFGCKASTVGVFFEKNGEEARQRTGSAGWYNTCAFTKFAKEENLYTVNINGDAFSDEIKQQTIEAIKKSPLGKVDLIIYSLASPRRTDPKTGNTHKSVLKTIGEEFTIKTLDTDRSLVKEVVITPANEEEIFDTTKTMGGEDWMLWIEALEKANVIAQGCVSMAYSYIGPELTFPIYRQGTIGKAKENLEQCANAIDAIMKLYRGKAFVSVNKALVTQASSAIPAVPLYISILYKIMKEKGIHEDCIMQIERLFSKQLYNDNFLNFDEDGLVRIDDWEMRPDVQKEVFEIWEKINTENLMSLSDYKSYKESFMSLFGFGIEGIDYNKDTKIEINLD